MTFVKGMGVLYCDREHTVIESNYLGVKVQNDETGVFAFVKASDADKALMLIESEVSIKPVEDKRLPGDDRKISELRAGRKFPSIIWIRCPFSRILREWKSCSRR